MENKSYDEVKSNLEIAMQGLECVRDMKGQSEEKLLLEAIEKKLGIIIKLLRFQ